MLSDIDFILVPAGPEYQAVCRGLQKISYKTPNILPVPIGSSINSCLQALECDAKILLMGLAGSLAPEYKVGDVVIYQSCVNFAREFKECELPPIEAFIRPVRGLSSDRLIYSVTEKIQLCQQYQAQVVDMEAFFVLEKFPRAIIIRVISDDCEGDLPNLNGAINLDGSLNPFSMTKIMLKNPLASLKLIQGSLKSLKILTEVSQNIFV